MAETAQQKANRQMLEVILNRGDKVPTDGRQGDTNADYDSEVKSEHKKLRGQDRDR